MNRKVLCVDDDTNILAACRRQLRKEFDIHTAPGGEQGLEQMMLHGPFAVIVSDMRMPGMDGIKFLARARVSNPETVRIMLTGNADLQTAMDAVNEGNIFQFLTKPCPPEKLVKSIEAGLRQYQLIRSEQELLKNTLTGAIRVLVEVLSMVNPSAFSHASRIRRYCKHITRELEVSDNWVYEMAATLSQIGCLTLPHEILDKVYSRVVLTSEESRLYASHPLVGFKLLTNIPRLESVACMIRDQQLPYSANPASGEKSREQRVTLGSQILKAATDVDKLVFAGSTVREAVAALRNRPGQYNPEILACLEAYRSDAESTKRRKMVTTKDLIFGMVTDQDIYARGRQLLVPKGQEITYPVIARLQNFSLQIGVDEPFAVLLPDRQG